MSSLTATVGKVKGHFTRKENRAAKLIASWPALTRKMEAMVRRGGGRTDTSRLAYAVLTMMETGIRVGNEDSAEGFVCENKYSPHFGKPVQTFGLTTLLGKHVTKAKGKVTLAFTGKKTVEQQLEVTNPVLVRYCPKTGGPDDLWLGVTYPMLFKFVKRYVGRGFTPKDVRTAKVNLYFTRRFAGKHAKPFAAETTQSGRKKVLRHCIEETAEHIGHTASVCRSSYLSKPMLTNILLARQGTVFTI